MKKLLSSLAIFAIPFLIFGGIIAYIDPYNVFKKVETDGQLLELKEKISYHLNYPLYALQEFDNNQKKIIVLGDSRAKSLDDKLFKEEVDEIVTNLAYGGGTYQEIEATFWHIVENYEIEKIYIGINFNLNNKLNNKNRVTQANQIRASYSSYLSSKFTINSTLLILQSLITNETANVGKPKTDKAAFWKKQLNETASHYLKNYTYADDNIKSLIEIAEYCKKNQIELVLFIPPAHKDLQHRVDDFELRNQYKKFLTDLKKVEATTFYDFNFVNELTENEEKFGDPFHFKEEVSRLIINILANESTAKQKYKSIYRQVR